VWPPLPDRPEHERAYAPVPLSVVASSPPVVASHVVASNLQSNATTDATTKASATTSPPVVVAWRIEINRRPKAEGGYSYHWLYRFGSGKDRRAVYGGTIDRLIAFNPARWQAYQDNSGDE